MSEEEQQKLAGETLDALTAARKELACLEEKRNRYLEAVDKGVKVLKGIARGYYKNDKLLLGQESGVTIVTSESNIEWPDLAHVGELVKRINDAKGRIETARRQLIRMGHKV